MNYVFEVAKGTVGASLYYAVALDSANSINELEQKDFVLYPNPASDFITIAFDQEKNVKGNLKIVNLLGKVVYESHINEATTRIDINPFASGIYYLIIESSGLNQIQKFVVR
ncbi:MAG: T9SS type A sorting domain-containing protein [Bacteroidetes bacterium]|nr:T9SS type A sorting domain-containing protein [Bacteroidota bacterium]